jgi:hypothetical protein
LILRRNGSLQPRLTSLLLKTHHMGWQNKNKTERGFCQKAKTKQH